MSDCNETNRDSITSPDIHNTTHPRNFHLSTVLHRLKPSDIRHNCSTSTYIPRMKIHELIFRMKMHILRMFCFCIFLSGLHNRLSYVEWNGKLMYFTVHTHRCSYFCQWTVTIDWTSGGALLSKNAYQQIQVHKNNTHLPHTPIIWATVAHYYSYLPISMSCFL